MKRYHLNYNVGSVKYVIKYHDGVKKHKDGSDFFDIATFKNKVKFNAYIKSLNEQGYVLADGFNYH